VKHLRVLRASDPDSEGPEFCSAIPCYVVVCLRTSSNHRRVSFFQPPCLSISWSWMGFPFPHIADDASSTTDTVLVDLRTDTLVNNYTSANIPFASGDDMNRI